MRRLYGQFRHLIHEGAKFLVVGGAGWVVTNVVYDLLRRHGSGPITSATVATVIASVVTYLGNRYWSFRHRERQGVAKEGSVFLVLNVIGLLIQDAVVGFNAYVLGLQHNRVAGFLALNAGIALGTLFRFWSYRRWVWAARDEAAPAGDAAPAADAAAPARVGSPGGPAMHAGGFGASGNRTGGNGTSPNGTGSNGHGGNGVQRRVDEPGAWAGRRR